MKNNKILSLALIALTLFSSSCLKDDAIFKDGGSDGIIEISSLPARTTSTLYAVLEKSFEPSPSVDLPITVNYTGSKGAPNDINVTLEFKKAIVDAYNATVTSKLEPITDHPNLYTVDSYNVVIPKGQKSATLILKLKTDQFNFSLKYGIGVAIKSVSSGIISGNYGSGIITALAKNKYDGKYTQEAGSSVTRYTAPGVPANDALSGSIAGNTPLNLATIDANTVEITGLKWAGNASGVSGIDNLRVTVDPTTNLATVFSLGNNTLVNKAGKTNKYDPATKTFTLNFDWNQTSTPREMTLVLKYSSAR